MINHVINHFANKDVVFQYGVLVLGISDMPLFLGQSNTIFPVSRLPFIISDGCLIMSWPRFRGSEHLKLPSVVLYQGRWNLPITILESIGYYAA
jgi:hypothetical protein